MGSWNYFINPRHKTRLFRKKLFSHRHMSDIESWAARRLRAMAVATSAKERTNPVPDSPEILAEARALWADHCAGCHANNGSGDVEMA
jgi:mono/diheme cytochrome c family protein